MKKKTKIILITATVLVIFAISFSVYVIRVSSAPKRFIEEYIKTRYMGTDYTTIKKKTDMQKMFIEDNLINSDFQFGQFDKEIEYFSQYKYIIKNPQYEIYDKTVDGNITNVFVKLEFNVESGELSHFKQRTYYSLQVKVNKVKNKFIINDIDVLDYFYDLLEYEHTH